MDARQMYGTDVQKHRQRLGLTQTELAEILGVSQSSLSHIETGRRSPSFRTLLRIHSVFDILEKRFRNS